ncbi:hypothetical protein ACHAWF_005070 [Thalassiosira exigua]
MCPANDKEARTKASKNDHEGQLRRSISVRLIRHAESQNNAVVTEAIKKFKAGTPESDIEGLKKYYQEHRSADPGISEIGKKQAEKLAEYLEPQLTNQASRPVRFVISPMRRTIETILPTLEALTKDRSGEGEKQDSCDVMIHGFYFETEGCHTKETPEPGMDAVQINERLLNPVGVMNASFEGFYNGQDNGWYSHAKDPSETRPQSEKRAAQFYTWMTEYLDQQLKETEEQEASDTRDAGVTLPGDEHEQSHDRIGPKTRKRETAIFVGHGDFMNLVLKRVVAGFGYAVEKEGITHRSAFVHFNTGITELEYFGHGRFLIMSQNNVPHLADPTGSCYITGGSLKDGWGFAVPNTGLFDAEVAITFSDEVLPHVQEQADALRQLYLSRKEPASKYGSDDKESGSELTVVVKRGLQVIGCASLNEKTGHVSDVVVRPSARRSQVGQSLMDAVKEHARQSKMEKIVVESNALNGKEFFEKMGFASALGGEEPNDSDPSQFFRMECQL